MAKTVEIKIPEDIEFRVIGNALGLLIASAGLLAGEMVRNRSLDYWYNDIIPLLLVGWLGFRLYRNFLTTMMAPQTITHTMTIPRATPLHNEQVAAGQITAKPSKYTAEKVLEEVSKRIESQKAGAVKRHTNNR